jgi:CBS domain-containing protein
LHIIEENKITSLLVTDEHGVLVGALNIHDLFREGLM